MLATAERRGQLSGGAPGVGADSSLRQVVASCRERGCSVHRISYEVPMAQIVALTTLSKECEQHVQVGPEILRLLGRRTFCQNEDLPAGMER